MSGKKPEVVFDLEEFLRDVNNAFLQSAQELRKTFNEPGWRDSPYVYHMPKMLLSVNVSLSYSDGKVKGFFSKSSTSETQELSSRIDIEVVSVPRPQAADEIEGDEI